MKRFLLTFLAMVVLATAAFGQATLTSTTITEAVADADDSVFTVSSNTGFTVGYLAYLDREAVKVLAINSTRITVGRGWAGTRATAHADNSVIYVGQPDYFTEYDRAGTCTSTAEQVLPRINIHNGKIFRCTNSTWDAEEPALANVVAPLGLNLDLESVSDGKPVRINSRNYTQTSGSSIGFQSKPAQTVTSTGSVFGGEISPRVNDDIDIANVIGLHVDAYLKGTTAKTISGDVRGLQVELVTDDSATNTVSGNVSAIRVRAAFSASTLTGQMEAIRIEKAELQTNSQAWDSVLTLTSTQSGVWHDTDSDSGDTEAGYIKVIVNGNARYILLYSDAPTL